MEGDNINVDANYKYQPVLSFERLQLDIMSTNQLDDPACHWDITMIVGVTWVLLECLAPRSQDRK